MRHTHHTTAPRGRRSAFTLIEILIVVIILGILAAVVVPQFTSASADARLNSGKSLLQTVRTQVQLYKLQHGDEWPTSDGSADASKWDWSKLTGTTTYGGETFGPYLQQEPKNPWTNANGVAATTTAFASATDGFVFTSAGKIIMVDGDGNEIGN